MLHTGQQVVAGMAGTGKEDTGTVDKAVEVDTVVLAEQQGTCSVLVSAVDAHQGQDQPEALTFMGHD